MFCALKDKKCGAGSAIAWTKKAFAVEDRECTRRCAADATCLSAFWDTKRDCHMRTGRCAVSQLTSAAGGTDFYRLSES